MIYQTLKDAKMISITKEQLIAMRPCSNQVEMFGRRKSMNAKQAFAAGASIHDLCWVAQKLDRKDLLVKFALRCAQEVSHLNTDPITQKALDATQAWLDNPNEKNRQLTRNAAANAAYAAADAAYAAADAVTNAADAAADAAYAAAAAATNAADATYAAAYAAAAANAYAAAAADAAYAAYAAARQKEVNKQKQFFIEIFSVE